MEKASGEDKNENVRKVGEQWSRKRRDKSEDSGRRNAEGRNTLRGAKSKSSKE
ncbi:unnamed protein product, partial [Allacma fusca]